MNYNDGLSASDVALLTNRNGNGAFGLGDGNGWWIILFLLVLFGGWGNRGFGGNYGDGGVNPMFIPYNTGAGVTTTNLSDAFSFHTIGDDTRAIQNSLCSGFAGVTSAINDASRASLECCCNTRQDIAQQGFNTVNTINTVANGLGMGILNGFNEVNRGIQQNGFNTQNCCCTIQSGLADLKYTVATENCADRQALNEGVRDIIEASNRNSQVILDKLCQQEIDAKNDLIANLRTQLNMADLRASQVDQTAQIRAGFIQANTDLYNLLSNCPVPSTPVYGRVPIFTCNNNSTCGCNCGNL